MLNSPEFLIKLLGGAVVSCWAYYTFSMYLLRRKYKRIPGPKANGLLF